MSRASLNETMMRRVAAGELSGGVTLIARGGNATVEPFGTVAPGHDRPTAEDTIFRIASMSKAVTAVAALMLVEECKIRLDDPVDKFLPELANRQVLKSPCGPLDQTEPASRPITLRDLLTFVFGYGMMMVGPGQCPALDKATELELGMGMPSPQTPPDADEWIKRFGTLPLMHQPGTHWLYHCGSDVVGVLIQRVSGQRFEDFLKERIFDPLGMKDTGFHVPPEKIDRFTDCYFPDRQTGKPALWDAAKGGQWSSPPRFGLGGGGLVSTVGDYWNFAQMLMNEGVHRGERLLSWKTIRLMTTDQITPEQKARGGLGDMFDAWGWGMGVSVCTRQVDVWTYPGCYGWNGGLGTSWFQNPVSETTGIILTQTTFSSPVFPAVISDFWTQFALSTDE